MARFEDTLTQGKRRGGANHHERTAGHLNTHTSKEGGI